MGSCTNFITGSMPDLVNCGYTIDLEHLCRIQSFTPAQVRSCDLVFPRGAVPNSMLLWIRVELISGEGKFVTIPLVEFYNYVTLPVSSIGGWTDGDRGKDLSGLKARYEVDYQPDSNDPPGKL